MPDPFIALRERLLRAGLRPSIAARYAAELRDHAEDIVEELKAGGSTAEAARRIAMERLGGQDALAEAILADVRVHGLTGRHPSIVFLLGPALVHALLLVGLLLMVGAVAATARFSTWTGPAGTLADILLVYVQPVIMIAVLGVLAWRQRSHTFWLIAGGAAAVLVSSILRLRVVLPAADRGGLLVVEPALPHTTHVAVMMAVALVCALLLGRSTRGTATAAPAEPKAFKSK